MYYKCEHIYSLYCDSIYCIFIYQHESSQNSQNVWPNRMPKGFRKEDTLKLVVAMVHGTSCCHPTYLNARPTLPLGILLVIVLIITVPFVYLQCPRHWVPWVLCLETEENKGLSQLWHVSVMPSGTWTFPNRYVLQPCDIQGTAVVTQDKMINEEPMVPPLLRGQSE